MGIGVLRKWWNIPGETNKHSWSPVLVGRRSRRLGIRGLGLLLVGSVWCGYALVATATTVTLSPGTTTLQANTSYSITTAGEYTVNQSTNYVVGTSLSVSLPGDGNNVALILNGCRLRPAGSPALTVTGTGTLRLRMAAGTSNEFEVRDEDAVGILLGEQSVLSVEGSGKLRVKGRSYSPKTTPEATIKGSSGSQIVVSEGTLRISGSFTGKNVQSPLVQNCSFLLTGGTVECVGFQVESGLSLPSSYTESKLFGTNTFSMRGGNLTFGSSATNTLACSEAQQAVVQEQISGGVAFGKRYYAVSSASTTLPETCLKLASGESLSDEERTTDEKGRIILDSTKDVQWHFVGEQDEAAAEVFRITPEPTEQGMKTDYAFGIAGLAPGEGADDPLDAPVVITAAVRLPESEGTSSRIFFIAIDRKRDETVKRVFGIAPVRFTYDTSSETFRAKITTSATMSEGSCGTSFFSVKAFSSASE